MVDETIVRNFSLSKLIFFSTRCEVQVKQLHTIRTFIVIKERREREELTLPPPLIRTWPEKVGWIWPIRFDPGADWIHIWIDSSVFFHYRRYTGWPFRFDYQIYPSNTLCRVHIAHLPFLFYRRNWNSFVKTFFRIFQSSSRNLKKCSYVTFQEMEREIYTNNISCFNFITN